MFSFYKTVTESYFGRGFVNKNKLIPVVKSTEWLRGKQSEYAMLIKEIGKPVFEYKASEVKRMYNYYKNNHNLNKFYMSK